MDCRRNLGLILFVMNFALDLLGHIFNAPDGSLQLESHTAVFCLCDIPLAVTTFGNDRVISPLHDPRDGAVKTPDRRANRLPCHLRFCF